MISKNLLKDIQSLHLKKNRDRTRRFIAEGVKLVLEAAEHKPELVEVVFGTAAFVSDHGKMFSRIGILCETVSEDELKKMSLQQQPNQVLAVLKYFDKQHENGKPHAVSLFLDEIRDPGNFGTILRLCDWFGLKELYCSPGTCDLYNPKVIQSSMGAFLRINVVYAPIQTVVQQKHFEKIYGAVLNGGNLYKQRLKPGLLIIGNEANGISEETLKIVTDPLTIPSGGESQAESLNAAVAASILVSEFFRQLEVPG